MLNGFAVNSSDLLEKALIAEIESQINKESKLGDILATLIALYLLIEKFEDKEDEWTLIAKKAKNWLRQQGLSKPDQLIKKITFEIAIGNYKIKIFDS